MCNPRRIKVSATRLLDEAWEREVTRTCSLCENVVGEARIRQPLDASVGGPALRALGSILADENSGWQEVDNGFRFDVEGGYVIYLVEERELEMVAVLEDEITATGESQAIIRGKICEQLSATGEGDYYDDGWAGKTLDVGKKHAQDAAQKKLDDQAQKRIEKEKENGEANISNAVQANAQKDAQQNLRQKARERQEELAEQARQNLRTVGHRCRQAFNQVIALAYRDSILAYARQHNAEDVQCIQDGDVVEIEFKLLNN